MQRINWTCGHELKPVIAEVLFAKVTVGVIPAVDNLTIYLY